ncbi:lantibiotic dehydratase [Pseudoduganella sp. HUAS MS19]
MPKDQHLPQPPAGAPGHAGARLLHPHIVLRVAGEPCAHWQQLHDGAAAASLEHMHALRQRMAQLAAPACAAIEQAVCRAGAARAARRELLAAKRAAFNGQALRLGDDLLQAWFAPPQRALLAGLADLAGQLHAAEREFAAVFEQEAARALQRLRTAARQAPALMAGIHYSNPALFGLLERWLHDAEPPDSKSARRLQATLLEFAMRAAFKTSPLSSFTLVAVASWRDGAGDGGDLGARAARLALRFNHSQLLHVLEALWRTPQHLGDAFPLQLNPTIRREGGRLHWQQLACTEARHGKFWGAAHPQRSAALSAPLQVFLATMAALDEPLTLASAAQALARALPAQHAAEARQFVDSMLSLNLLHPYWPRYQQDDLLDDMLRLAPALAPQAGGALRQGAVRLRALAQSYPQASLAQRVALRRDIDSAAAGMAAAVGASLPRAPVFFEDCSIGGPPLHACPQRWSGVLDDLQAWLALQPLFDPDTAAQSWLAARFVERYGAAGVCCDIAGFLHSLESGPVPPTPAMAALRDAALDAMLAGGGRADAAWCRELAVRLPGTVRRRGASQVFFGQRTDNEAAPHGFVVNRVYGGSSMLLSRFLGELPQQELALVRRYIGSRAAQGNYLELPGVFGFNGNLHPRLADGEVLLPGAQPGRAGVARHSLETLRLVYNAATDRLDVLDAGGVPHELYYFGFLQARNLAAPFRWLARNASPLPELWQLLHQRLGAADSRLLALPRVQVGSVLVARRSWVVPRACWPDPHGALPAFARALHALRRQHGLPDEVFARFDGKPFYLHLDSPLHLRQLAAAIRSSSGAAACIQEALPAPGVGTLRWQGRDHVAEMQIEMTLPGI